MCMYMCEKERERKTDWWMFNLMSMSDSLTCSSCSLREFVQLPSTYHYQFTDLSNEVLPDKTFQIKTNNCSKCWCASKENKVWPEVSGICIPCYTSPLSLQFNTCMSLLLKIMSIQGLMKKFDVQYWSEIFFWEKVTDLQLEVCCL